LDIVQNISRNHVEISKYQQFHAREIVTHFLNYEVTMALNKKSAFIVFIALDNAINNGDSYKFELWFHLVASLNCFNHGDLTSYWFDKNVGLLKKNVNSELGDDCKIKIINLLMQHLPTFLEKGKYNALVSLLSVLRTNHVSLAVKLEMQKALERVCITENDQFTNALIDAIVSDQERLNIKWPAQQLIYQLIKSAMAHSSQRVVHHLIRTIDSRLENATTKADYGRPLMALVTYFYLGCNLEQKSMITAVVRSLFEHNYSGHPR
jgi:hypothetical protein